MLEPALEVVHSLGACSAKVGVRVRVSLWTWVKVRVRVRVRVRFRLHTQRSVRDQGLQAGLGLVMLEPALEVDIGSSRPRSL